MIIDCHTHVLDAGFWPREWFDHVAADWAGRAPGRRPEMVRDKVEPGLLDPDGDRMVAAMDRAGVAAAVVLPWDWGPDFHARASVQRVNEHALAVAARHRGRIIPFAGVDPRRPGAAELVERFLRDGPAYGVKLYPACGWDPAGPAAQAVYDVCQSFDVPVLFHTGHPLPLLDDPGDPLRLLPVVRRNPALRVWLGHAGAPDGFDACLAVAAASEQVSLELSVWLWSDSTGADVERLASRVVAARDAVGIGRLLFGSDHVSGPRTRGESFLPTVVDLFTSLPEAARRIGHRVTGEEMNAMLGRNAARQLHWRAPTNSVGRQ
ncbi:amidohydrolase family protein [Phytohabitans sp. ZYX-F-186]|uniref:Amidohydrolase family protein n=1 Tax=Phytohabitans maris TaxID=3071409 RepID=A0ABU0ZSA9_9ACTN|nr:amidohydrolase family protein [Phytohabitans sp. ZYX-F-186]MDQ7909916.1 amidohydrolase family protein [Phytohabitans sp. ZYX-F-186]